MLLKIPIFIALVSLAVGQVDFGTEVTEQQGEGGFLVN